MIATKLNGEYALRVLGVAALMFGICGWSIYDGTTAWPRSNTVLAEALPALLATNLTAEAWLTRDDAGVNALDTLFGQLDAKAPGKLVRRLGELRLPANTADRDSARAAQLGQVRELFEKPVYDQHDLKTQFVQAAITALLGAWAVAVVGLRARKRFYADERGLHGSGVGGVIEYSAIERLDWGRWSDKGILKIVVRGGRKIVLDGWHYKGMVEIVNEVVRQRPELAEDVAKST